MYKCIILTVLFFCFILIILLISTLLPGEQKQANRLAANVPKLVLSPQAGMGNRCRAMAYGIWLAQQTHRSIYHHWLPESNLNEHYPYPMPHLKELKKHGWSDFFQDTLPVSTETPDLILSEHVKSSIFWDTQSTVQKAFPKVRVIAPLTHELILSTLNNPAYNVVVLETSECLVDVDSSIYQSYLVPQPHWLQQAQLALAAYPAPRLGVHIRRGDFLHAFAQESNISLQQWITFITKQHQVNETILLFGDDVAFLQQIQSQLAPSVVIHIEGPSYQSAFVEWLLLGHCDRILATPKSSFAQQAAKWGQKPYIIFQKDFMIGL